MDGTSPETEPEAPLLGLFEPLLDQSSGPLLDTRTLAHGWPADPENGLVDTNV
jgi:hypothetical protein